VVATKRNSVVLLKQQIAALQRRVTWLEKALRPKPAKATLSVGTTHWSRELEEAEAQRKAIDEFFEEKERKRYLEDPELLAQRRKRDREINAFLRSRGLKPLPNRLPRGLGKAGARAQEIAGDEGD
jgi:hypothetical protein